MTDTPVSPLRQRMIEDMTIRKLAPRTQQTYIRIVFAVRFREDKEGDCELRPLGVQFRCPGSRVQLDSQKLVGEALKLMRPGTAGDEASRGTAGSENDVFPRNMIFVARKCWNSRGTSCSSKSSRPPRRISTRDGSSFTTVPYATNMAVSWLVLHGDRPRRSQTV